MPKIRINTKAKTAPSVKKTIFEFEDKENGRGTEDYNSLADEFLVRIGLTKEKTVFEPNLEVVNG